MPQLHDDEILIELLCEDEGRTRRKRPGPASPFRSSGRVNAYDFFQLLVIESLVVRGVVHLGDLEPDLDGRLYRLGKIFNVPVVCIQGAISGIGLRVEISRVKQGFAAYRRIVRLGCEALIFAGGVRQLAALPVGVGDLFGGLELQFVLREGSAKRFKHIHRRLPVLHPD